MYPSGAREEGGHDLTRERGVMMGEKKVARTGSNTRDCGRRVEKKVKEEYNSLLGHKRALHCNNWSSTRAVDHGRNELSSSNARKAKRMLKQSGGSLTPMNPRIEQEQKPSVAAS